MLRKRLCALQAPWREESFAKLKTRPCQSASTATVPVTVLSSTMQIVQELKMLNMRLTKADWHWHSTLMGSQLSALNTGPLS